jgi:hypothetical protein
MRLTLSRVFVIILFISLFALTADAVRDPDFWWHLRTGEYIVENHTIPKNDPSFSFTTAGKRWITHEWLSEVLLWGAYRVAGLPGLSLLFAGLITLAYALVFARSPGQPYNAGFATLLAALTALPILNVRPQVFTLVLLSLLIFLLERYFLKPSLLVLISLPAIMLLWVNLHGGFLLGLVVIGVYLIGKSIELLTRPVTEAEPAATFVLRDLLRLAGAFGLCIVAAGANPNGYRILAYPLGTLTSPAMQRLIGEWFSPNFHELDWIPLAILLLGILAIGLYARKREKVTTIGLVTLSAYAALRSVRNVPLFAIVAAPVLASQLSAVVPLRPAAQVTSGRSRLLPPVLLAAIIIVATSIIWLRLEGQGATERQSLPVGAVDWIEVHQPPGNLFNTYHWGGYLIWRLSPDYPVFIDGRADLHGDQMLTEYVNIYNTDSGWEQALSDYGVNLVLVEPTSLIAQGLEDSAEWEKVYADNVSVLLERR